MNPTRYRAHIIDGPWKGFLWSWPTWGEAEAMAKGFVRRGWTCAVSDRLNAFALTIFFDLEKTTWAPSLRVTRREGP